MQFAYLFIGFVYIGLVYSSNPFLLKSIKSFEKLLNPTLEFPRPVFKIGETKCSFLQFYLTKHGAVGSMKVTFLAFNMLKR